MSPSRRTQPGSFRLPTVPGRRPNARSLFADTWRGAKRLVTNIWFVGIAGGLVAIELGAILLHIG